MEHIVIFKTIREEFCSLFTFKSHGSTLEVITPVATLTNKFVSVFVTQRGNDFIVADGGWISDNIYDQPDCEQDPETLRHLNNQFIQYFGIAVRDTETGRRIYYKSTDRLDLIPARVFDIANFIQALVNSEAVEYKERKEKLSRDRFRSETSDYLKFLYKGRFQKNAELFSGIKFSAVITHKEKLHVFEYVTGHDAKNFENDIYRSIVNFEILEQRPTILSRVASRVAIFNDESDGFNLGGNKVLIEKLREHTTRDYIRKSNIESIQNLIPIGAN